MSEAWRKNYKRFEPDSDWWVEFWPWEETVVLDGRFTLDDLERIVVWMKQCLEESQAERGRDE